MTAPTPRPDESLRRGPRLPRPVALAGAACLVFAAFVVALTRFMPAPHARTDYLIIGTLSTLAAMITVFAGLLLSRRR